MGFSVHSPEAAVEKDEKGADYLFFGHVFASGSKPGQKPRGLDQLRQVKAAVGIPVIAIGGVTAGQIPLLAKTGCDGVAVISAIADVEDPGKAARNLKEALLLEREGRMVPVGDGTVDIEEHQRLSKSSRIRNPALQVAISKTKSPKERRAR